MVANKNDNVTEQVQIYEKQFFKTFKKAAKSVRDDLEQRLKEIPIRFSTSFRAKESKSLEKKLINEELGHLSIDDWLPRNGRSRKADSQLIKDLAGIRISLYFPSDW